MTTSSAIAIPLKTTTQDGLSVSVIGNDVAIYCTCNVLCNINLVSLCNYFLFGITVVMLIVMMCISPK